MAARRADMFAGPGNGADPRAEPPGLGDERSTLVAFLRWQRETLELKCSGLDAGDLARRSLAPATLSLLGLVRHLAEVERRWFRVGMAGLDVAPYYYSEADPDGDFDGAVPHRDVVAQAWSAWRAEIEFADQFIADAPDLDLVAKVPDRWLGPMSLRWVLVHLIEEYSRHNGHADLLREQIDGALGR